MIPLCNPYSKTCHFCTHESVTLSLSSENEEWDQDDHPGSGSASEVETKHDKPKSMR